MNYGDTHIDRALTGVVYGYENSASIAESICPPFFVERESDKFHRYGKDLFRPERTGPRAFDEPATRAPFKVVEDEYELEVHTLYDVIADRRQRHADNPLNLINYSAMNMRAKLEVEREIACKNFVNGALTGDRVTNLSAAKWNVMAGGVSSNNPIDDLNDAAETIRLRIGRMPNAIVMPQDVFRALQGNTFITDRFINVREGRFDPAHLSLYLDWLPVGNLYIGNMVQDTEEETITDDFTGADIWTTHLYVFVKDEAQAVDASMEPMTVTLGRNFRFPVDFQAMSWRQNNPPGDVQSVAGYWGFKVIDADAGQRLSNAI